MAFMASIQIPKRRRHPNFMTFIPAGNVAKIKEPALVVSIKGAHNDRPKIDDKKHHVFKLDFDVGSWAIESGYELKVEQLEQLMAFLETHKDSGRDLYIHCTEGRIRSYTIASMLRGEVNYDLDSTHLLAGPGRVEDRDTCRTCLDFFRNRPEVVNNSQAE